MSGTVVTPPRAVTPRFVIGIDLGTTNSALAWADLHEETTSGAPRVRRFEIAQLVGEGEVSPRPTLPSFLYLPAAAERAGGLLRVPWADASDRVAGMWARDHGGLLPGRQIASAKSWLCHPGVDRHAAILPWDADPAERVCSPVDASTAFLKHLRDAWNHTMAAGADDRRLERQDIVLTVPASFDEEARELTVEAARAAGFEHLTLQEEPTAALYAWIATHQRELGRHLRAGDTVLVCDVGGGTTDFTLVKVGMANDELTFERVAVGDHLLLGGDNLDLALARSIEGRLTGPALTLRQRQALRRQSGDAKEKLLSPDAPDQVTISVLGSGRALVGGSQTAALSAENVRQLLFDGFLPAVDAAARPSREGRSGLRELGLPYEADPAITRHLATFLAEAGEGGVPVRPDAVLLNGGFFTPAVARDRLVAVLESWFESIDPGWHVRVLANESPATAVAEGAAAYGLVRHGFGGRIGGGAARAYYIGLQASGTDETTAQAVCVLARGTEEGSAPVAVSRLFEIVANRPRAFSLWSSRTRKDAIGDVIALDPATMHAHAPLVVELRYGKRSRAATLPVRVEVAFTELGTLELWLVSRDTDHRWRLQFELRGASRPGGSPTPTSSQPERDGASAADAQALVDGDAVHRASEAIAAVFGAPDAPAPEALPGLLESLLGLGRQAWPLEAIRPMADTLLERMDGRRISSRHEARWLNLLGFCLRPGFGATLDDFRMTQARKVYLAGLAFPGDVQCQAEWLVLWQRIAGGLTAGQQQDIYHRLAQPLLASLTRKGKRLSPQVERETWRLLASLERIPPSTRATLGNHLLARLEDTPDGASLWWALGRIGARTPTYGPLNTVVPPASASAWLARALELRTSSPEAAPALVDVAAFTGDAARDIGEDLRERLDRYLEAAGAADNLRRRLHEAQGASRAEWHRRFGETIPEGLTLTH